MSTPTERRRGLLLHHGCPPELSSEKDRLFPKEVQETDEQCGPAEQELISEVPPPPQRKEQLKKNFGTAIHSIFSTTAFLDAFPGARNTLLSILRHLLSLFR